MPNGPYAATIMQQLVEKVKSRQFREYCHRISQLTQAEALFVNMGEICYNSLVCGDKLPLSSKG
jgi:hypothetical protein